MKKIQAFTIMELLVAMVLLSLVNMAGWQAWELCALQFGQYKNTSNSIQENKSFDQLLRRDFENCKTAEFIDGVLYLNFETHHITYVFEDKNIQRINSIQPNYLDMFAVEARVKEPHFMNSSVNVIDHISYDLIINQTLFVVHLNKTYDADFFVNL